MKKFPYIEEDLKNGDKIALWLSRFMSTWFFISILGVFLIGFVTEMGLLHGAALDVFNLIVSLYTLFVDLIILRSAISQRNMDRALGDRIFARESEAIKLLKQLKEELSVKKSAND